MHGYGRRGIVTVGDDPVFRAQSRALARAVGTGSSTSSNDESTRGERSSPEIVWGRSMTGSIVPDPEGPATSAIGRAETAPPPTR